MPSTHDLEVLEASRQAPGWELVEYRPEGELEGFVLLAGTEMHCHFFEGMPLKRKQMRAFLEPIFARHGHLTTRVAHDDIANQRLNRVFGFEKTWSDDQYHYYQMSELPFGGGQQCQQ